MFYIRHCIICNVYYKTTLKAWWSSPTPWSSQRHLSLFTTSLGASRSPKLVARWPRCSCWKGKQLRSSLGKERYACGWAGGSYWSAIGSWFHLVSLRKTILKQPQNPEESPKSGENMRKHDSKQTVEKTYLKIQHLMDSFEGNPARNVQLLLITKLWGFPATFPSNQLIKELNLHKFAAWKPLLWTV